MLEFDGPKLSVTNHGWWNIKVFSVTEDELRVLASPWSWRRRRSIVNTIKRESSPAPLPEDTE